MAFPCSRCEFVARGPGALEEHMAADHAVDPEPQSVPEIAAVPVHAVDAVPVKQRVYTCKTCQGKIAGFRQFLNHKKSHKE